MATHNGHTSVHVSDTETWERNKKYTVSEHFSNLFKFLLVWLKFVHRRLRARRALSIFKEFRWEPEGHYPYSKSSIENQKDTLNISKGVENQKGAIAVQNLWW